MLKKVTLAVVAALAAQAASASSIDFHGYYRAGLGWNAEGGAQACTGNTATGSQFGHFRYGDECDQFFQATLTTRLFKKDAVQASYTLDFEGKTQGKQPWEVVNKGGDLDKGSYSVLGVSQNFAEITGFWAEQPSAKAWIGKRYIRRDIHMLDSFYWGFSGVGAGVENIDAGFAKFNVAVKQTGFKDNNDDSLQRDRNVSFMVEANGIKTIPNGALDLQVQIIRNNPNDNTNPGEKKSTGYILGAEHSLGNVLGGFLKVTGQFGKGQGALLKWNGAGVYVNENRNSPDGEGLQTARVIVSGMAEPVADLSVLYVAGAAFDKSPGGWIGGKKRTDTILGARAKYSFSEYFGFMGQVGFTTSDPEVGTTDKYAQLTAGPVISAGKGAFARPEFRAFVNYAKKSGSDLGGVFGAKNDNLSFGFQTEAWW